MQFAKRIPDARPILRHLLLALSLGVLFAVLGPFGSYPALTTPERFGFWMFLVLFGYGGAAVALILLSRIARLGGAGSMARLALSAAASAIPTTFATAWLMSLIQPGRVVTFSGLPALFAAVACVQLVVTFVLIHIPLPWVTAASGYGTAEPEIKIGNDGPTLPGTAGSASFFNRIPARLGTDLLAVEAEDHYLRIHTSMGTELTHMRMSDALRELGGADGLQVHRGWWVSRSAVRGQVRKGNRTFLTLTSGVSVPVSRTFLMAVRSAQWGERS